jgi:ParB family chromosome partitioning protein
MNQKTNDVSPVNQVNNEQSVITVFNSSFPVNEKRRGYIVLDDLKEFLPKADTIQYETLSNDIKQNGIHSPILFIKADGEKILVDGHIRLKIAEDLGIENIPELEICDKFQSIEEVKIWMVRNQCQRRNLSKNEKIKMAYQLKDSIAEIARKNLVLAGMKEEVINKVDTLEEIGKIAGVSRASVARFQCVKENASEKIKQQMIDGEISINNAYEQLKNSETENDSPPNFGLVFNYIKPNYLKLDSVKDGTKMIKSGELDCILIIQKDNENLIADTSFKTGLFIIE